MTSQCCGKCRFLDVGLDKAERRVPLKSRGYHCLSPIADLPALPDSITQRNGFRPFSNNNKGWMFVEDGRTCPMFERWTKPAAKNAEG